MTVKRFRGLLSVAVILLLSVISCGAPSAPAPKATGWNVVSFEKRLTSVGDEEVFAVEAISADRFLVGTDRGSVYEVPTTDSANPKRRLRLKSGIMDIETTQDGRVIHSLDLDGNVAVIEGNEVLSRGEFSELDFSTASISADASLVGLAGFKVGIWYTKSHRGLFLQERPLPAGGLSSASQLVLTTERTALADGDGVAEYWFLQRQPISNKVPCNCNASSAIWSSDAKLVAFGTRDGRLIVWEASSGRALSDQTLEKGSSKVAVHAVLDSTHVLYSTSATALGLWDTQEQGAIWTAPVNPNTNRFQVSVSPDGAGLAVFRATEDLSSRQAEVWTGSIVRG